MAPPLKVAIVGTSWWVDSMYLPALSGMDSVELVAVAGRRMEKADELARAWSVAAAFDDWQRMLDETEPDAVVVAAPNSMHYPVTLEALRRGMHVLCEKPIATTVSEADHLVATAKAASVVTMVPFTYSYMPGFRFLEQLTTSGYVGAIHHVGLRYHAGYGIADPYLWKLDARHNPSGALGDIGSHFLYLGLRLGGDVVSVTARLGTVSRRAQLDPRGEEYPLAPDTASVILEFESGAMGTLTASAVAYEGTSMNQRHVIEVHGDAGTLRYECDWDFTQSVSGARVGDGPVRPIAIPDEIWGSVRRDTVHNTYRDVFRTTDAMARGWVSAILAGRHIRPDLADGAQVQRLIELCLESSVSGERKAVKSRGV